MAVSAMLSSLPCGRGSAAWRDYRLARMSGNTVGWACCCLRQSGVDAPTAAGASAGIRLYGGHRPRLPAAGPGEHRPDVAGPVVELVVEVDRGVDQGQVAERLREVAELLPGQADLFRKQAQVVGVGVHLLEHQLGLAEPAV